MSQSHKVVQKSCIRTELERQKGHIYFDIEKKNVNKNFEWNKIINILKSNSQKIFYLS